MDNMLSVNGLTIKIKDRLLMQDVSFDIAAGEAVLLSGPNGCGKSSILKSIMRLETAGKQIDGQIKVRNFGDVLSLSGAELQRYRSRIAYIPQKDEFSEMGSVQVRDIISESGAAHAGRSLSYSEVNDLIDEWIPRRSDNSRVFDAKARPARFSGGEQRLLSVLSVITTRPDAELLIIDEPLNNLDFANARNISNLINRIKRENPQMGLLMVSHCRIFPFITREIKLTPNGISNCAEPYICYSCFGEPDCNGDY